RVRMGENCQKPGRSVTKTGNSSTPITQMKPCNGCGLGVFQGRLLNTFLEQLGYSDQKSKDRSVVNRIPCGVALDITHPRERIINFCDIFEKRVRKCVQPFQRAEMMLDVGWLVFVGN
ncbi:hypothetical protein, partial [Xanthomonas phaseoli]|uniref:hypothetical protein n=1 Tax=Xanthomonas phaseoli TaxID=1985254 RepID=UPI00193988A2